MGGTQFNKYDSYAADNLTAFGRQQYVDVHCHCLPAVDDGPATMAEALALCRRITDDCVAAVIATPHQLGRFSGCNEAPQIREAVAILNRELKNNNIALTVAAGGDVRVDERICQLLEADRILTLADGGKYILLELPHEIFVDIEPLLVELSSLGIRAIISHPERHPFLAKQPKVLCKWLERSAYLQVTAASLLGDFGPAAEKAGWDFLNRGWVSIVATDSHDSSRRRPRMKTAFEHISGKMGHGVARLLCIENPSSVLTGRDIASVCAPVMRKYINEKLPTIS